MFQRHKSIVELLLDRGADIHAVNKNRADALYTACIDGNGGVVKLLLKHGANVNSCTVNKWTPLHSACNNGHVKCVEALHCHGAEVDVKLISGQTPLALARQNGHESIVNILKEHMKAKQKRKVDHAGKTNDSRDSIPSENKLPPTTEKEDEERTTNTSTIHDLELKIKKLKEIEVLLTDLEKKNQKRRTSIKVRSLEKLEAQKSSQCTSTGEVNSNLAKIQEMLEKQINNQQAPVKDNMALLEEKLVSTIQETLKRLVTEAQTCLQGDNEATTDDLKKKKIEEVLVKQLDYIHSLVDQNIERVLEQKLDSKIQDVIEQHYERLSSEQCSKSSFKRRATGDEYTADEHIDGSSTNKRLKVTVAPSSSIQEMVLKSNTETQEAIQQSIKNMDRKNFRKDIILIGLCGVLKFMCG